MTALRLGLPTKPRAPAEQLCTDPYRLFFPIGVLLGWWGVGQWLLFSLQLGGAYRVVFHSMAQVQGFLGCFIAGFLFTFIPRRTMTAPPRLWQVLLAAACPVLLCVFAWREQLAIAQGFWLLELGVLSHFVISRAMAMKKPQNTPASLIFIPLGLGLGVVGSLLTALPRFHDLGRALLLEGMPAALVMGIGAMLVPIITRAQPPAPTASWELITQAALSVVFVSSFVIQAQQLAAPRVAYALRLLVVGVVLVRGARLWVRPTEPGLNRLAVWVAAWCLPLGYTMLVMVPSQRSAGLHVIFLGAFGLLAMTVGQHVIAAHAGRTGWLARWAPATGALVGFTALALVARVCMAFNPANLLGWLTCAALAFVAAGGAWLWGMAPLLRHGAQ